MHEMTARYKMTKNQSAQIQSEHSSERKGRMPGENEGLFANLFYKSNDPILLYDLKGNMVNVNQRAWEALEYTREELLKLNINDLYPDEEKGMAKFAMERVQHDGFCRYEISLRKKSGETLTVEVSGGLVEIGDQALVQNILRDITERKMAQQAIQRLRRENELILNTAAEGIFGLDMKGRVTFINPAAAQMIGYEPEEVISKNHHELVHNIQPDGSSFPVEECSVYRALREKREFRVSRETFRRKDGAFFPVEYVATPLLDRGEVTGVVVTYRDITEERRVKQELCERANDLNQLNKKLARSNRKLEEISITDALTGVANRRRLTTQVEHEIAIAQRSGRPLIFLMLDLDYFKKINDTYGHQKGDEVLRLCAKTFVKCVRGTDLVARYGGEEFAVVMPDSDLAGARNAAERIRLAVESLPGEEITTVSIGLVAWEIGQTTDDLFACADKALYTAKEAGRNRVVEYILETSAIAV